MIDKAHLPANERKALLELKKQLDVRFGIKGIKLFGSKARGESTSESDIDIMIEIEDRDYTLESEIFSVIYAINLQFDCFISPLFMSRSLIVNGPMSESPIYKSIEREGLAI